MPRTTTEEEGAEASESRPPARRRGRRNPVRHPTAPTVTTRSRAAQSKPALSEPDTRRRSRAAKRARAADKSPEDEENVARKTKKRKVGDQDAAAASASAATEGDEEEAAVASASAATEGDREPPAASASAATEQASSSKASAVSSPIRRPYIPRVVKGYDSDGREILEPFIKINPAIVDAHEKLKAKYFEKHRRQLKLVTLDWHLPQSCLADPRFLSVRESAMKTVLKAAKVVLGLSSYIDGNLLARCSGFLIDWDEESKVGTVLTSALLIRSKHPSNDEWLGRDQYAFDAEVYVHLLDKNDTVVVGRSPRYYKHYNLALLEIDIDLSTGIPSFSSEVKFGQEVFVLGRDENMHLNVDHSNVEHKGPSKFERHHYMFTNCGITKFGIGGPVIYLNGQIAGMINLREMAFIPSTILLKCLHMLKKFKCIPRLQVGMKFTEIKFLDAAHIEKISRKCNIDEGLIVKEVSEGSVAEKLGVRPGDIIESWNGECVSTTLELENLLLRVSEEHLDKGHRVNSNVDIRVGIFHTRKDSHRTITLTVNMCDDVEVVATGDYAVSDAHCVLVPGDDVGSGQETPHETGEDEIGDN